MAAEPNPQQQIDAANYQILQQQRDEANTVFLKDI
jgi:hypothetical protein